MSHSPHRAEALDGVPLDEVAAAWEVPLVEAWHQIDSTNDRAVELARSGTPRGTVVVADQQLRGRGRHGGRWLSASGSGLWMSIVLDGADAFPQVTLLAGVATAEAIEAELPEARVTIRWPNDLMLDEGKVGGILAESVSDRLVLGIGVNLSTPSDGFPELRTPPATLRERAKGSAAPTRSGLARSVISHLRSRLDGTHPARDAIEALARQDALLGRWVDTEQEGVGVARGIDAEGRLVLERRDGTRVRISAGRVTPTSPDGTGGAEHVDGSNSSFGR